MFSFFSSLISLIIWIDYNSLSVSFTRLLRDDFQSIMEMSKNHSLDMSKDVLLQFRFAVLEVRLCRDPEEANHWPPVSTWR